MQRAGEILQRVLLKRGLQAEAEASLLLAKANRWLGEHLGNLAGDVRAVRCKEGVLILEAKTSVATQEAFGLHRELLEFLKKEMPRMTVESIRIFRGHAR